MVDSSRIPISLGRWDPYQRTPSVSLQNGKIRFLPGRGSQGEFAVKEAVFPAGAKLEYRVQKGDRYFDGDHSQSLGRTLWAVEPDGSSVLLADGFVLYISLTVAARNLKKRGIPFRAVSFYETKDKQVVEQEIPIAQSGARSAAGLILGSSNLLLGAMAGALLHSVGQIVALGAFAFAVLAILTLRSASSKCVALVSITTMLFTYAAGYAASVLLTRWVLGGHTSR
jgi:hypothetical protein